jgi:hypothetical protein
VDTLSSRLKAAGPTVRIRANRSVHSADSSVLPLRTRRYATRWLISVQDPAAADISLFEADSSALYAAGHLFFASRDESAMTQAFDLDARRTTGDAFLLAEHVSFEGTRYVGASVSQADTLVYAHSDAHAAMPLTGVVLRRSGRDDDGRTDRRDRSIHCRSGKGPLPNEHASRPRRPKSRRPR